MENCSLARSNFFTVKSIACTGGERSKRGGKGGGRGGREGGRRSYQSTGLKKNCNQKSAIELFDDKKITCVCGYTHLHHQHHHLHKISKTKTKHHQQYSSDLSLGVHLYIPTNLVITNINNHHDHHRLLS